MNNNLLANCLKDSGKYIGKSRIQNGDIYMYKNKLYIVDPNNYVHDWKVDPKYDNYWNIE